LSHFAFPNPNLSMTRAPLILLSPCYERSGTEFSDASISLSNRYTEAIAAAGGLPLILPATQSREAIAELVQRGDGVMLTGGADVQSSLYTRKLPRHLARNVKAIEPERDAWEHILIEEVFRQRKPLFAICRGHQMLNVALGGTLIADIPAQVPGALDHRQMKKKMEPVHEVTLTPGSLLARITAEQTLKVNSTHHQAIGRVAKSLRVSARCSADGVIEGVELKDALELPFLLSVQFHPERLIGRDKAFLTLFGRFVEACAKAR
jgi:putative glutamine amidotransferase